MKIKLVRDHVARRSCAAGEYFTTAGALLGALLVGKLHEEVQEVAEAPRDPAEYADVLTALQTLAALNGVDWMEVERVGLQKLRERGGFDEGWVLVRETEHCPCGTPWSKCSTHARPVALDKGLQS